MLIKANVPQATMSLSISNSHRRCTAYKSHFHQGKYIQLRTPNFSPAKLPPTPPHSPNISSSLMPLHQPECKKYGSCQYSHSLPAENLHCQPKIYSTAQYDIPSNIDMFVNSLLPRRSPYLRTR